MRLAFPVALALVCAAPPAVSQPPATSPTAKPRRIEPVVVTASRAPQPLDLFPGSVDVITREEIEAMRYESVVDVLRHVVGLHVDQPSARGSRSSIYMRGLDPNQTLVLVDGIRLNDPTNNRGGFVDLSTLETDDIDRIEIVRGPLSAVHGPGAMAGVVHIITRTGEDGDRLGFEVSGGRFGYIRALGSARASYGIADLSLSGSYVDEGDPGIGNHYEGVALNTSLGVDLPAGAALQATLRFARPHMEAFPDDSGGPEHAVFRELEERKIRELGAGLELRQEPLGWLSYSLSGTYYHHKERRTSPGIAPGLRNPFGFPAESSDDLLDRFTAGVRTTAWIRDELSLTLGGDTFWEEGSSDSVLEFLGSPFAAGFDLDRFVGGFFAEASWQCPCGLVVQSSLRLDVPDHASTELTPRVRGSYRVPRTPFVLSASWGEGFKLPSFFALGNPIVGNPDLRAEKSRGFDVGVSFELWKERATVNVTYFDLSVRDLVDFDPEIGPFGRLVNRTKVVSRGLELGLQVEPVSSLLLSANVTYTEIDIRDVGDELLNRPRWRGDLALVWRPTDTVTAGLEALFVGKVFDSSVPTGEVTLDAYQRVDLSASWRVRDRVTLYLTVDNLLDQDYEEAVGFPSVGIRPIAGIALRL